MKRLCILIVLGTVLGTAGLLDPTKHSAAVALSMAVPSDDASPLGYRVAMPIPAPPIERHDLPATARAPAPAPEAAEQEDLPSGAFLNLGVAYYTQHAARPASTEIVQIRIDPAFTTSEREKILDAVREWNHVLNGHVRIAIGTWDAQALSQPASATPPPADPVWTVHRADRSIYTTEPRPMAATLTLPAPSASVVVFVDRLRAGGARIDRVMLHEIGHALGLQHDPRGHLMQEWYSGSEQICIDRAAVENLAQLRGIPVKELNWCTY